MGWLRKKAKQIGKGIKKIGSKIAGAVRKVTRSKAFKIVAAIALLAFFWGLVKFIAGAGNEDKRTEGKQVMLWGIISLFVLFVSISVTIYSIRHSLYLSSVS